MLKVHDLNQLITMFVLKKGLKANPFYSSLSTRLPYDLIEVLASTNKYINTKKGMVEKWKEKGEWKKTHENNHIP